MCVCVCVCVCDCRLVRLDEAHGGLGLEEKKERVGEEERARGYETARLRDYEEEMIMSQGGLAMYTHIPRGATTT